MIAVRQLQRPYTLEDLAEMPDDGRRYEILGGELIVSAAPSTRHQLVSLALSAAFRDHLKLMNAGVVIAAPLSVFLSRFDIVQPDIVVVLAEHLDRITESGIEGAPDLVVEILSPSSQGIDRIRKSATYANHGVTEYWLVDCSHETMLVQRLVNGRYEPMTSDDHLVRSTLLPGFTVNPSAIFSEASFLSK